MRRLPQYDHCDLGLVDDDNTEDMRKPPASSSVGGWAQFGGGA